MKPPEVKPETKEHNGKKGIPFSILFCTEHSYLHHYNTGIYGGEKSWRGSGLERREEEEEEEEEERERRKKLSSSLKNQKRGFFLGENQFFA